MEPWNYYKLQYSIVHLLYREKCIDPTVYVAFLKVPIFKISYESVIPLQIMVAWKKLK